MNFNGKQKPICPTKHTLLVLNSTKIKAIPKESKLSQTTEEKILEEMKGTP